MATYQSKYTGTEIDSKLDQVVSYEEKELLTSKTTYSLGGTTAVTINKDLVLNDDITKYDALVFRTAKGNGQGYEYQLSENTILVSNVVYNNSDTNSYVDGSRFTINSISGGEVNSCGVWFKNSTTLKVYNTFSNNAVDGSNTFDFLSIKGIKLGGGSSSSVIADSLSANFVEITPVEGDVLQLTNVSGNMTVKDGKKIVVKAGQRVQINAYISYTERDTVYDTGNIRFMIRDITNNIDIHQLQAYQDKEYKYEHSSSISTQYTNETNTDCEIAVVCVGVFGSDTISSPISGITVHEISRTIQSTSSGSTTERAFFEYKNDTADTIPADSFLPLTNTYLRNMELDSEGYPVLKAGKNYKVTFNISRINIPNTADNCFYLSMTKDSSGTLELISLIHPVARSTNYQAQNITNYVGCVIPTEDFSLKLITTHAINSSMKTKGAYFMCCNLFVEEV